MSDIGTGEVRGSSARGNEAIKYAHSEATTPIGATERRTVLVHQVVLTCHHTLTGGLAVYKVHVSWVKSRVNDGPREILYLRERPCTRSRRAATRSSSSSGVSRSAATAVSAAGSPALNAGSSNRPILSTPADASSTAASSATTNWVAEYRADPRGYLQRYLAARA